MKTLIVEDQRPMRSMLRKMLQQMKFFDAIDEAENGEKAWSRIEESRESGLYRLVISDVAMPELDGIGLLKRCRQHPELFSIPFIMISASSHGATIASALGEWGASDFIVKPFSYDTLYKRVGATVKRLQSPEESLFRQTEQLLKRGSLKEALRLIEHWESESQLSRAKWHNLKGECLIQTGQAEKASAELEKAISISSIYVAAYKNYALAQQQIGNVDKAIETMEYIEELSPTDEDRTLSLGKMLLQTGREEDGKKHIESLIKRSPKKDKAAINKKVAGVFLEVGFYKEAAEIYQSALRNDPGDLESANRLGIALRQQGKFDEAEKCYMDAIRFNPDHSGTLHNLGVLYWVKKDLDRAQRCLRKALELDPDFEAARTLLQTVEEKKAGQP